MPSNINKITFASRLRDMFLKLLYLLHLRDRPVIISPTTPTYSSTVPQAGVELHSQPSEENIMASPMLAPMIKFRYTNNNGFALVGGKVYTSVSGTNTPLATFADPNGDAFNTNPVILDARGEADIWLQPGRKYRFTIKDANDVVIDITDKIIGASPAAVDPGAVSILAYGADPTGVTDSTAAIQAAIVAASDAKSFIYAPAGNYKITTTITNSGAPNFMGIVGDSEATSVFEGDTLTTNAFVFTNVNAGSRFENFSVNGPGQTAPVSSSGISLLVDGLGPTDGAYNVYMRHVATRLFPTYGFHFAVPFVCVFDILLAQEIGTYGFYIDTFASPYVGGTSTTFNSCYANNVLDTGFMVKSHVYSAFNSCAADSCNVSYNLNQCSGQTFNSCGFEGNTYIDASKPGIGFIIDTCLEGIVLNGCWGYALPNAASLALKLIASTNVIVNSISNLPEATAQTYDIALDGASLSNTFTNCANLTRVDGRAAFDDALGENSTSIKVWGNQFTPVSFNMPDIFGNAIYVKGHIDSHADAGQGNLNLFTTGNFDYPAAAISNSGAISLGDGVNPQDVTFTRLSPGILSFGGAFDTSINVVSLNNPQIYLNNSSHLTQWAVSGDNDGGLAFYDAQNASTPMFLWNVNGVPGQNGVLSLNKGISIESGAKIYLPGTSNSVSGVAIFPAMTSVTVFNSIVTATSRILVTIQNLFSGAASVVYVSSVTPGVGFTLTSVTALDATVAYLITES